MQNRTPIPRDERPPIPAFTPVPRKRERHDGWTEARQCAFIEALADSGSVTSAAKQVNMSTESAYALRRQEGAGDFRAAWAAALDFGVQRLQDVAMDRALNGVVVPVFWKGEQVGEKRRYNDRLLTWILRHHRPEKYQPPKRPKPTHPRFQVMYKPQDEKLIAEGDRVGEIYKRYRAFYLQEISRFPAKRAAWEELCYPVDWERAVEGLPQPDLPHPNHNNADLTILMALKVGDMEMNEVMRGAWLGRKLREAEEHETADANGWTIEY